MGSLSRLGQLTQLYREIFEGCRKYDSELVLRRLVPAAAESDVFLIGQALGRDTQRVSGLPYCLPANPPRLSDGGRELDRFLARFGYTIDPTNRSHRCAYHSDLVHFFPGRKPRGSGDREPTGQEIDHCRGWLEREIELVAPKVVITLGRLPTTWVLARYAGIRCRRLRDATGRRFECRFRDRAAPTFAAYHPSGAWQFPSQAPGTYEYVAEQVRAILRAGGG